MRYIGGKENLLNFIDSVINEKVNKAETFADVFAGTAVVTKHFKEKNYTVISNDILYFSYLIQRTYIQNNAVPPFHKTGKNIYEIYDELNNLKGIRDYFFNQYAPSGKYKRLYLSDENAAKIDSIQKKISNLKTQHLISDIEEIRCCVFILEIFFWIESILAAFSSDRYNLLYLPEGAYWLKK
jgi:adenine-specific DNA-methyltransferase